MPQTGSSLSQLHFKEPFLATLAAASHANIDDDPNYYAQDPRSLSSTSTVHSFMTGTGDAIYQSLAPLLESTNHELLLVTCFWARSSTLDTLNHVLRTLSDKAIRRGAQKIRVRLCFSSLSLFQKLFHTQSVCGQAYPPSTWMKKLGLPDPATLGGLDLQIKSVFLLPFCVMHPKFIVVDRQTVILPSCNISWEEWFEGCITFSGPVAEQFMRFYTAFWERDKSETTEQIPNPEDDVSLRQKSGIKSGIGLSDHGHAHMVSQLSTATLRSDIADVPTVFLPSPHRRDPRFRPFASSEKVVAPPTPLNAFLLTLLAKAERNIRIQSPNVTSPPVLGSLLKALERGIDVTILTSERLMVLEQVVTAGTTTSRCMRALVKRYENLARHSCYALDDEEAAISAPQPGRLRIAYFQPLNGPKPRGQENGEPQQSHLKMTIVDDEVVVLGSGNLDRASWFTSQELGVAFFDTELVKSVQTIVDEAMKGRAKVVYDSGDR